MREEQITRVFALSVAFAALAVPAVGASAVDTSTVTCMEYLTSFHNEMVAIEAAFHEALKADPKLGTLSQSAVGDLLYKVCFSNPDAKVIDALKH